MSAAVGHMWAGEEGRGGRRRLSIQTRFKAANSRINSLFVTTLD